MFMIFNNNDCYLKWIRIHLNLNFFLLKNYLFLLNINIELNFRVQLFIIIPLSIHIFYQFIHHIKNLWFLIESILIKVLIKLKLN